jgi:hypothetical protein
MRPTFLCCSLNFVFNVTYGLGKAGEQLLHTYCTSLSKKLLNDIWMVPLNDAGLPFRIKNNHTLFVEKESYQSPHYSVSTPS